MLENSLEMVRYFKFESVVVNEKKQNDRTRFRFVSHSAFVSYGLDLSNFLHDFERLRVLKDLGGGSNKCYLF